MLIQKSYLEEKILKLERKRSILKVTELKKGLLFIKKEQIVKL